MGGKLQFLQTGALRLNDPLLGVSGMAAPLQLRLEDARYQAALRLFQSAIREQVEAVVLVGDTVGTALAGSRAPWFLHQQFILLAKHGIAVIVRGDDLPSAPNGLTWPTNVHLVSAQCPVSLRTRSGETLRVCDDRGPLDFSGTATHQLVMTGTPPAATRSAQLPTTYWACNGDQRSLQSTLGHAEALAAGPLQGANFEANGTCGALLVTLEGGRATASRLIPCDAVRWQSETLQLEVGSTWEDVQAELVSRMTHFSSPSVLTIVRWRLTGEGPLFDRLWSPRERSALLAAVQRDATGQTWITEINAATTEAVTFTGPQTDALHIARSVASQLTSGSQLELPVLCQLPVEHSPPTIRTLSRERYLQRLQAPLDQRLYSDLLTARSA